MSSPDQGIDQVIRLSFSIPHSLSVVSDVGEDVEQRLCGHGTLQPADFDHLARGFRWGAVGAYDGESYVVWSS
jgi:hypothetical protein